ncbi:MAG: hypothetical protein H7222_15915 [Methylotenera sp.]|nr:hypothetical protein [Oligoflexia bacterium]
MYTTFRPLDRARRLIPSKLRPLGTIAIGLSLGLLPLACPRIAFAVEDVHVGLVPYAKGPSQYPSSFSGFGTAIGINSNSLNRNIGIGLNAIYQGNAYLLTASVRRYFLGQPQLGSLKKPPSETPGSDSPPVTSYTRYAGAYIEIGPSIYHVARKIGELVPSPDGDLSEDAPGTLTPSTVGIAKTGLSISLSVGYEKPVWTSYYVYGRATGTESLKGTVAALLFEVGLGMPFSLGGLFK